MNPARLMPLSLPLLTLLLLGCPDPEDPSLGADMGSTTPPGAQEDMALAVDQGPMSGDDAGADDMGSPVSTGLPSRISTTQETMVEGQLGPGQKVVVALEAQAGDRVQIWLRRRDQAADWDPYLALVAPGKTPGCVGNDGACPYSNPSGPADAHLPYREADLARGWELRVGGEYQLIVQNLGQTAGAFDFSLECVGGPCGGGVVVEDGYPWQGQRDDELVASIQAQVRAQHRGMSYDAARGQLFEVVDNIDGVVEGVYTGVKIITDTVPRASQMNTEHTWPQSRGADTGDPESDLHHLFPTVPEANSTRSNLPFCNVVAAETWEQAGSKRGQDARGDTCFEPRDVHKGNVARALFYFAVAYGFDIDASQEAALRAWHTRDPVDLPEQERNDRVATAQGSRNAFVDHPDLVDRIADF